MKRIFLILLTLTFLIQLVYSQDVIILRNGDDIQAFVQKVGDIEIEYKKDRKPQWPKLHT